MNAKSKKKQDCEFHLYSREVWGKSLIDFTEMKLIRFCSLTKDDDDSRNIWLEILKQYRKNEIVAGWKNGEFIYHIVVKESR